MLTDAVVNERFVNKVPDTLSVVSTESLVKIFHPAFRKLI